MITQQTKSKSLFELFKERVIENFGDYFCCIYIFSAKLFICSQTFVNLKYIKKLEISYEFDVRLIFTPMYGGFTECSKTHRWLLLFIDKRHFIGFLHKQNYKAASTEINLLSLNTCIGHWWNVKRCSQFRRKSNLQYTE